MTDAIHGVYSLYLVFLSVTVGTKPKHRVFSTLYQWNFKDEPQPPHSLANISQYYYSAHFFSRCWMS